MYEARSQEEILKALQSASSTDMSKIEGTFENDVLASNSIEFAKQEVEREQMYKAGFAQTSWGEYLDLRAEEHGIFRKHAVKSIGAVTVTGNGTVPAGSLFSTESGVKFHTLRTVLVKESADINIEAETAGISGNIEAGLINKIPMSIPGIKAVINAKTTYDGFDEETDSELLKRLLFKVQQPATSGNVNHYKEWGMSVEGVGKIGVKPLWAGNGTVKVIVTDANGKPASDNLLTKVKTYVDSQDPIGATVTYVAPQLVTIDISLMPTNGTGNIAGIKNVVNRHFLSDDFDGNKVSYSKIDHVILDNSNETQVFDMDNLKLNGQAENITITDEQLPTVGQVILSD